MLWQTDDIADMYPWNILVKIRGDKTVAYNTVKSVFERISDGAVFTGAEYIEQEIEADYADQRRILHIVGIFTLVAILISALGLVAMSTYYIQQKEQEVAVRKVFGSTRGEVLTRLVGNFMRLVGAAFVIAVPWRGTCSNAGCRITASGFRSLPSFSWPRGLLPPWWHSLPSSGRAAVRPIPTRSTRLKTKDRPDMKNFLFALRYLRKLRGGTVARVISLSLGLARGPADFLLCQL